MTTTQVYRSQLLEFFNNPSDIAGSKKTDFVRSLTRFIEKYDNSFTFQSSRGIPLNLQRKHTPPRSPRIGPRLWNTPVSPFTGVAVDGSDGEIHAPLPLTSPPISYELFSACNLLTLIRSWDSVDPLLLNSSLIQLRDMLRQANEGDCE